MKMPYLSIADFLSFLLSEDVRPNDTLPVDDIVDPSCVLDAEGHSNPGTNFVWVTFTSPAKQRVTYNLAEYDPRWNAIRLIKGSCRASSLIDSLRRLAATRPNACVGFSDSLSSEEITIASKMPFTITRKYEPKTEQFLFHQTRMNPHLTFDQNMKALRTLDVRDDVDAIANYFSMMDLKSVTVEDLYVVPQLEANASEWKNPLNLTDLMKLYPRLADPRIEKNREKMQKLWRAITCQQIEIRAFHFHHQMLHDQFGPQPDPLDQFLEKHVHEIASVQQDAKPLQAN